MKTARDYANLITIEEPRLNIEDLYPINRFALFNKLRYFYWKQDLVEELVNRADLIGPEADFNIETAILKHLASLSKEKQAEALGELAESYSDELFDLEYSNQPMLDVFEGYEAYYKLIKEE